MLINLWAIHHDPDSWKDPFCFRPERFLDEQGRLSVERIMPFSAGTRSCPGESLGRKAVFLFSTRLLYSLKFECPPGEKLPDVEDCDIGIVLDCKPFKICAAERRNIKGVLSRGFHRVLAQTIVKQDHPLLPEISGSKRNPPRTSKGRYNLNLH